MSRKYLLLFLALIISAGLLLFGCGTNQVNDAQKQDAANGEEQQEEKDEEQQVDLIKLSGGDWGYPSPYAHYPRGPGTRKMRLIFDTLLNSDADGNDSPRLASDWEVSPDGLVYTLTLQPEAKWQDGQQLTADDVVFSYEYQNQFPPVNVADFSSINKVETVDDKTVKVELEQPDPFFLENMRSFTIIPKHIWEEVTDPYNFVASEAVVGTGPYRLTDYSKEHGTYRFEENESYWGSKPRVKAIELIPVSEDIMAFEQGAVDRISATPDILPKFENNPEYRVMQYETTWSYRLYFNMNQRPELADKTLRQALAYAIDRQELVDMVERGAAVPGNPGVLHPSNELYNAEVPQYTYNRQKAEELLDSLGYKDNNGDGIRENSVGEKLSFRLLADDGSVRIAELIKQQLALIGIEVNVQVTDNMTRDARFEEGDFELCINGSGGVENLSEVTTIKEETRATSTTADVIGYSNPEVDRLYSAQEKETDLERKRKLMEELQQIVAEELPKLTIYYRNDISVHRPSVYDGWSLETYHNDHRLNFVAD
ncbi:ABC transporter substrate-binding protein [Candidatus Contubernalis alkaliaceticus]|uniref:ABC transporter substrate-binding protein n=1 Tax=Candidatus Contubernalis alkaliaceticus TaxID=338645 RepID=UPI001F4BD874|nr:ABC transporter substrate-binding protein [Candidatus Contubernalis alkalaceticus]UNC93035.1 diguanylate phosphodiesterase [Candidatus Contubernalis alkalaceticus]